MNQFTTPWPKDRLELLLKWWAEGLSASTIAARLGGGLTRNAIIGKVNRMARKGLIDRTDRPKFLPDGKRVGQGGTGFVAPQFAKHMPKSISAPAPAPRPPKTMPSAPAVVVPEHASTKRGPKSKPRQEAQKPHTVARMVSRHVPPKERVVGPPRAPALTHPAQITPASPACPAGARVTLVLLPKCDPSKPGIFDLTAYMCRWPNGDPQQPDFYFCGARLEKPWTEVPYCEYHKDQAWGPGTESERRAVALKRSAA